MQGAGSFSARLLSHEPLNDVEALVVISPAIEPAIAVTHRSSRPTSEASWWRASAAVFTSGDASC
jgi:hypothetical protein